MSIPIGTLRFERYGAVPQEVPVDGPAMTKQLIPHLVCTGYDSDGKAAFISDQAMQEMTMGNLTGVVSLWEAPAEPIIPQRIGAFPQDAGFAPAGFVKFGRAWMAPARDGELNFTGAASDTFHVGEDPTFHATDTIDLGVVHEGEADLELEDGQVASLKPGSCFVLTGIQHRWRVTSAVPLVFSVFTLGANRDA